jgi:hypothetical protein
VGSSSALLHPPATRMASTHVTRTQEAAFAGAAATAAAHRGEASPCAAQLQSRKIFISVLAGLAAKVTGSASRSRPAQTPQRPVEESDGACEYSHAAHPLSRVAGDSSFE